MGNTISYSCTKCELTGSSTSVWGEFFYYDPEGSIPLIRTKGLCHDCETITPVEVLPSEDPETLFYLMRDEELSPDDRRALSERRERAEFLQGVKRDAVCLECGGSDFDVIPQESDGDRYGTGLEHRGCGGKIMAERSTFMMNMGSGNKKKRYYNREGQEVFPEIAI